MTARQLILWRHGQTAYNAQMRMQGQVDVPLDDQGLTQVAAAAQVLAGVGVDAIVSSDLVRAQQTAQALASQVDVPVALDARLRERSYGQWEGLSVHDIERQWPGKYQQWRAGQDPTGVGIETRPAAMDRMLAAIAQHIESTDGTLVVTSHGGVITCAITGLLGLSPADWLGMRGLGNAHFSVLWPNPDREPAWRLVGHNLGMFMLNAPAAAGAVGHGAL